MQERIIRIPLMEGDATAAVIAALKEAQSGPARIVFEKGVYRFLKEHCHRGWFHISNNMSGEKRVVFPILEMEHLTIDGNGAEFLFSDRVFPFVIQNSRHVTLMNFSVDFSFPRHFEGRVVESNERCMVIEADRTLYDFAVQDGALRFPAGSEWRDSRQRRFFLNNLDAPAAGVAYLAVGDCRDVLTNLPAQVMRADAADEDGRLVLTIREGSKYLIYPVGSRAFIGHDENRENDMCFAEFSEDIAVSNVSVYRAAGMGFIMQATKDISIENTRIIPRPGRGDSLSVTADALHFVNCSGTIKVDQCTIEASVDDAINVHGNYSIVSEVMDAHSFAVSWRHHEQLGAQPYFPGDVLHLSDKESMNEKLHLTISKVAANEDRSCIVLTAEEDIAGCVVPGDIVENPGRMPHLIFTNNHVINCPQMRISCPTALIEHNKLALRHNGIYINDLFQYWYESGAVRDILIRDNEISSPMAGVFVGSTRNASSTHQHGKVTVTGNRFHHTPDKAVQADRLDELVLEGNEYLQ